MSVVWAMEDVMVGQTVSHYTILARLGGGGMGVVYKAEDAKLHRLVALKFLPREFSEDPHALERFEREAQAASALNHPHICTIHDIDEADGQHFIAMELLEGHTLKDRLQGPPLPTAEIVDLGLQLSDALEAAHAKGIIHRDLKPANIFVTTRGTAKLLDFGLAKLAAEPRANSAAPTGAGAWVTGAGVTLGTVGYMSPEQVRGETLDTRTDLFSLGVVLYEMATGRAPFGGATAGTVLGEILTKAPTAPVRLNPELPSELERIINKALEKDRDLRYQTASEIRADLQRLKRESDSDRRPAVIAEAPRSRPVRRWLPFAAVAVPLACAGAAAAYLYIGRGLAVDTIAILPFENVGGNPDVAYLSDGIPESLTHKLSELPRPSVKAWSYTSRYAGGSADVEKAGRELGVHAVLTGKVTLRGQHLLVSAELVDIRNHNQIWGQSYARTLADIQAVQADIVREVADKLRLRLTGEEQAALTRRGTENAEAYRLYLLGREYWKRRTVDDLNRAIECLKRSVEADPRYADAYAGLADALVLLTAYDGAPSSQALPMAKEHARAAVGLNDELAEAHASLGLVLSRYDWNWKGAEEEFEKSIALNPGYATAHQWYGELLAYQGRSEKAVSELERALELDPFSPVINSLQGTPFFYNGRFDEAIARATKAIKRDPTFPTAYRILGASYSLKGMYEQAVDAYLRSIELWDGDNAARAGLCRAYALAGRRADALRELDTLMSLSKTRYVPAYRLAAAYVGLSENDKALWYLKKACDDREYPVEEIGLNPIFGPLRSDPRFQALLRRVNFPAR